MSDAIQPRIGLCSVCQHARVVTSGRGSQFWMCERVKDEPTRFRKYPPLPVLACPGFEAFPSTPPAP